MLRLQILLKLDLSFLRINSSSNPLASLENTTKAKQQSLINFAVVSHPLIFMFLSCPIHACFC